MNTIYSVIILLSTFLYPLLSQATIPLKGYLIAEKDCPALHSIKKGTNPENVHLTPGMAYEVTGKNKPNETHYLIKIEQQPALRWVAHSCGKLLTDCQEKSATQLTEAASTDKQAYLLAISWQPAFCETHREKIECIQQTEERYDAHHLTLHGLWPQPRNNVYCNVNSEHKNLDQQGNWASLPVLELNESTRAQLSKVMPGVASHLQRHEWIKHGSCYSETPETYYQHSLALLEQINQSPVRQFLQAHIGQRVTADAIRTLFNQTFGEQAGNKVDIRCRQGMITELWIHLQGEITATTPLRDLLSQAESTPLSCQSGLIDPVGFD